MISKAKRDFGYEAKVSVKQGIERVVQVWFVGVERVVQVWFVGVEACCSTQASLNWDFAVLFELIIWARL